MSDNTKTIIQEDVTIKGNIFEKEDLLINGKMEGNLKGENIEIENKAEIKGNIKSKDLTLSGKIKGEIESNKIHISSTANVEGNIKQKILSIDEGAKLKIKTETSK
tara:strand:- start:559 stop:876 length:318 start_codon:yes stop_codon:yes gene_type:complete